MDSRPRSEYFVLAYDPATMKVRSFTGHGHDFVGAVLRLAEQVQEHRDQPEVVVRLYRADSFADLLARYPDPFKALRFPDQS